MAFARKEIAKGIFLNTIEEHKFKSGVISMRFILPLSAKTVADNSLIFPVLRRGCVGLPDIGSIRREEESLYETEFADSVFKRGDSQVLEFRMRVLNNKYALDDMDIEAGATALMLAQLFDPVLENGVFCLDYVESEKEKLIDDILSRVNDKYRYARQRVVEEMFDYEGDAYGISELGTEESVSAVTPEGLYEAYTVMLKTARIEIFVVGEFDFSALEARLRARFSRIERKPAREIVTATLQKRDEVKRVFERQNITQGKLMMGFVSPVTVRDENYHVMQVLNMIFGGGATSKLFCNVREKKSLCYYCGSSENGQKGYLLVSAGIEATNEKKTADEILVQLDEMRKGNISDGELLDAKLALLDSVNRIADSAGALVNWHFSGIMNGRVLSPEEKRAQIRAVTKEEIAKMASDIHLHTYYFLSGKENA